MRLSQVPMALLTTFILLLGSAAGAAAEAAQDDAGSGGDAPDSHEAAIDVALTSFTGTLDPLDNDRADWYRFIVPPGKGLRVTMQPATADFDLLVRDDQGSVIGGGWRSGNATEVTTVAPSTGAARIGVVPWSGSGGYSVSLEIVELPNLAVRSVAVSPVPVETDMGPLFTGTQRIVRVVVENHGEAATLARVDVWSHQQDSQRAIGGQYLELAPGAVIELTFDWDATGQLGDADVTAYVYGMLPDLDWSDNSASTSSYAVVGGSGFGVDLLNNYFYAPVSPVHVGAATSWSYQHHGAYAGGYALVAGAGAGAGYYSAPTDPWACAWSAAFYRCV